MTSEEIGVIQALRSAQGCPVEAPAVINQADDDTSALTRRLAVGDEVAFHEFHARYFDRLYHFLLVVTGGQEQAAQEALQDALLRVARYVRTFPAEEAFWGWLKVVARSAVRDAGRKQRRYLALLQHAALRWDRGRDTAARDPNEHLHAVLAEVLGELKLADRQLVEGKYLEGATVNELARNTGGTEKAVESRLVRLRRRLREQLLRKLRET